jgi:hypothetical protein
VSTRITQRTRTNGWQNSIAASSATTFSIRTDDPSLSTMMAPALTVTLGFGKQSGLRAVSKLPFAPQLSPEPPPFKERLKLGDRESGSSGVVTTESASEPTATEIGAEDAPVERRTADWPSEQFSAESPLDTDPLRFNDENNRRLADPLAEFAAAPADPEPIDEAESHKPVHPHRIEMTIDSLPHHDLTEPIPIYIDPLGDTVFTATVAHLDISATGNSIGEALVQLKEQIEFKYGDLNRRPKRTPEQTTMLQMMHTYIAPTGNKPAWL